MRRWILCLLGMVLLPPLVAFGLVFAFGYDSPYLVGWGLYIPMGTGLIPAWYCPFPVWGKLLLSVGYLGLAYPTLLALYLMMSVS